MTYALAGLCILGAAALAWCARRIESLERELTTTRAGLTEWYETAYRERQARRRAELGYGEDVPTYLFSGHEDRASVERRLHVVRN